MTTTKSYSNNSRFWATYKSFVKRLFPIMMVFTIIFFLLLPLISIVNFMEGVPSERILVDGIYVSSDFSPVLYVISAAMAVILALAANSYMHQKRIVDLYHSIPVTRTQLFTAGFLSSMTVLLAPLLANYFLAMIIQWITYAGKKAFYGVGYALFVTQDLTFLIVYVVAVYLFVSFVSVNVGTLFDTFAISGILGFSVIAIYMIGGFVFSELTYGFNFSPGHGTLLLSPFTFIFFKEMFINRYYYSYGYDYNYNLNIIADYWKETSWGSMAFFLLCSLAFVALLWFLCVHFYKKRKSESAERPQSSGKFQTGVKIFASFCGAAMFFVIFISRGVILQIIAMLIGAVLIGIIAELIFSRGVRSLLRNLKWLAGTGVLCGLLIIGVRMDFTGYVKRVPAVETVESISISYTGRFYSLNDGYPWIYSQKPRLTEPASIGIVTQAHTAAVADIPFKYGENRYADARIYPYTSFSFTYTLKNGRTMTRYYNQTNREAYALLSALESQDDFIMELSPLFTSNGPGSAYPEYKIDSIALSNTFRSSTYRAFISDADTNRLLDAIRQDLLGESLSEILYPSSQALGVITLQYRHDDATASARVIVTEEYVNTISILRELELYDKLVETDLVPDSVYITESYDKLYQGGQVSAFIPSQYNDTSYQQRITDYVTHPDYDYDFIVSAQDQEEMEWLINASRTQMMVNNLTDNDTFVVVYCIGDRVIGHGLIAYQDLPPRIQQEADTSPNRFRDGVYRAHSAVA